MRQTVRKEGLQGRPVDAVLAGRRAELALPLQGPVLVLRDEVRRLGLRREDGVYAGTDHPVHVGAVQRVQAAKAPHPGKTSPRARAGAA